MDIEKVLDMIQKTDIIVEDDYVTDPLECAYADCDCQDDGGNCCNF